MHLNAREAMHIIELRTSLAGHSSYRKVCQTMHELLRKHANHHAIADSMKYVNLTEVELGRLDSENKTELTTKIT